jgi:hypothetical protein
MVTRVLPLLVAGALVVIAATQWAASPAIPEGERWGVDQLRIHRTADGRMLDLRYRVVEPDRARSLLAKDSVAYLVHDRSGTRLPVPSTPKAGALRNHGRARAGRSYFALFTNAGALVKPGDRVTVVLGELTAHLTVE